MPGSIARRRSDEGRASLLARAFNCFLAGPRIGLWQAGRRRRQRHQTSLMLLLGAVASARAAYRRLPPYAERARRP
jgi:hypothetical protein